MNKGTWTYCFTILLLVFTGIGCGKTSSEPIARDVQFDRSQVSSEADSALLAVIMEDDNGSVVILFHSTIEPIDTLRVTEELPNKPLAEIVLLTFAPSLSGVTPEFLKEGDSTEELSQLSPIDIFHTPFDGTNELKRLSADDQRRNLIQAFSNMLYVPEGLITITPTPGPSDTEPPTAPILTNVRPVVIGMTNACGRMIVDWTPATDNVGVYDVEVFGRNLSEGEWSYGSQPLWTVRELYQDPALDQDNVIYGYKIDSNFEDYYCYQVRAVDEAGNKSPMSNEYCARISFDKCRFDPISSCYAAKCIILEAEGGRFFGQQSEVSDYISDPDPSIGIYPPFSFGNAGIWANGADPWSSPSGSESDPETIAPNYAEYPIHVMDAGVYYIWLRLWRPNEDNDAFEVRVLDDSGNVLMGWHRVYSDGSGLLPNDPLPDFQWQNGNNTGNAMSFVAQAEGTYTIQVASGEPWARLDQILLIKEQNTSTYTPSDTIDCPGCNKVEAKARKATGLINIDGQLTETDWFDAPFVAFHKPSESENLVKVFMLWDDTNLYLAYEIWDGDLVATTTRPLSVFEDDSVIILLDIGNDMTNDYTVGFTSNGLAAPTAASFPRAVTATPYGYILEIAIPFAEIPDPADGSILPSPFATSSNPSRIGILLGNNDRDSISGSVGRFDWSDVRGQAGTFLAPDRWGDLILVVPSF